MNKRLTTCVADANRLQRAIRPTGFFNIKKMAADFCSAQCIMGKYTVSLNMQFYIKCSWHLNCLMTTKLTQSPWYNSSFFFWFKQKLSHFIKKSENAQLF